MASFNDVTGRATQFWTSRDPRQKMFLLVGAGVTVLLLALFARLIGTPDYQTLSTGLEPSDAQRISAQLDAQNIPHETSADGKTISVPASKLDAARMAIASVGTPGNARAGFELFDKLSWGQTEFDQKVTYQRALEGELERSIETLSEVASARVHLVMATDSVFLDRQRAAKASVILKLRGNGLSKDAVMAISRMVSGAVDSLQPEDVSIVDADSSRSLGLGHAGQDDGEGLEASLTQRLISTLEPVVGTDKIRATVRIDQDQSTTEENQEKYDPSVSALLSDQKSQDQAGPVPASTGVPGTSSNIPSGKAKTPTTPDENQSSMTESAQYGVNKVMTRKVTPAGRIERVSAAILVDDAIVKTVQGGKTSYSKKKRTAEELNKIQQLAEAVIGFDAKRGDTISVQDMSFDSNAANADLPAPNWVQQQGKNLSEYSSLLRPAGLLVLFLLAYMFVLRPIQKQALAPGQLPRPAQQPALPSAPGVEQLPMGTAEQRSGNQRANQLKEQTIEMIKQKPINTTRAVQAWLHEEGS
ncbi:MAG: flagellar basal-body MS-ring/collar protein FliF [Terracidiphilus sp.]